MPAGLRTGGSGGRRGFAGCADRRRPAVSERARALHAERWSSTGTFTRWTASSITAATSAQRKADGQFDLPRAKEGGLGALFFSIFVTEDYYPARLETKQALRMLDSAHRTDRPQQPDASKSRATRRHRTDSRERQDRRRARYRRQLRSGRRPGRDPADVPPGHALGAAFRAQLDQQLCRFLLLGAEMARAERSRPRGDSRNESPRAW